MDIPADLTISIADIRRAGHCARMAKWFHDHGLRQHYRRMIKGEPIEARLLAETGHPFALRVIRRKMERLDG